VQLVVVFDIPYTKKYYNKYGGALTIIFSAMPWAPFMKAINDLGDFTRTSDDPGISWARRSSYCNVRCCPAPPPEYERFCIRSGKRTVACRQRQRRVIFPPRRAWGWGGGVF
jgi:hypothetical protein